MRERSRSPETAHRSTPSTPVRDGRGWSSVPAPFTRTSPAERLLPGVALAAAFALKVHYSLAGADDLRWILGPTALLVARATGSPFTAEAGVGYLSTDLGLLIAPACAGVNFLIVALLTGAFGLMPLVGGAGRRALFLVGWVGVVYVTTVVVNAGRLLVSLGLRDVSGPGDPTRSWLTTPEAHRVEGVVVYLSALFALFLVSRATLLRSAGVRGA